MVHPEPHKTGRPNECSPSGRASVEAANGMIQNFATSYVTTIVERFKGNKEISNRYLRIMKDIKQQRISPKSLIKRVKKVFRGHDDLILGFNAFLPPGLKIELPGDSNQFEYYRFYSFMKRVKDGKCGFKSIVRIMKMYHRKEKSLSEAIREVDSHFQDRPDLREELFELFHLPSTSMVDEKVDKACCVRRDLNADCFEEEKYNEDQRDSGDHDDFEQLGTDLDNRHIDFKSIDDIVSKQLDQGIEGTQSLATCSTATSSSDDTNTSKKSLSDEGKNARPLSIKDADIDRDGESNEIGKDYERDEKDEREYYLYKPGPELDLSNCQRCTPSYCLLPENYPMPPASYMTQLNASVLNDVCVSATSGSEDYSFKHMLKNQYEKRLFRCEDDMFEFDMLLESIDITIKRARDLLEKMTMSMTEPNPIRIEDHFTSSNLRCIESIYGDHGMEFLDILRRSPTTLTLGKLLYRLEEKKEEWSRCSSNYKNVWSEIFAKNHHRSLDQRSFFFKKQDSESMKAEALLAEIRELNDKNHKEDVLLAIAIDNHPPLAPKMEFEYIDSDIHEDLYGIIKHACREACTSSNQLDKVMKIWTTFLEPILGVPPRPHTNDTKIVDRGLKNSLESAKESKDGSFANEFSGITMQPASTERMKMSVYLSGGAEQGVNKSPIKSCDGEEGSHENHEEEEDGDCGDQESEVGSEGETKGMTDEHDADREISSLPFSEFFWHTVKPLTKHVPPTLQYKVEKDSRIFYGDDSFYILFRLHQKLYERILSAKLLWRNFKDANYSNQYAIFLNTLYNLLDGTVDIAKFEDFCLSTIGTQSYILFTLDKLINEIVKKLQFVALDEIGSRVQPSNQSFDLIYRENARFLLHDEPLFHFSSSSNPTRLTIQLIEYGHKKAGVDAVSADSSFTGINTNEGLTKSILLAARQ